MQAQRAAKLTVSSSATQTVRQASMVGQCGEGVRCWHGSTGVGKQEGQEKEEEVTHSESLHTLSCLQSERVHDWEEEVAGHYLMVVHPRERERERERKEF